MNFFIQFTGYFFCAIIGAIAFSVAPVIVYVRTQGAEYLLNDALLIPALIFTLGVVTIGVYSSYRTHRFNRPLIYTLAGVTAIMAGLWLSRPLAAAGYLFLLWAIFEDYNVVVQYHTQKNNKA
ncbi:MAG: hypothetical protein AABY83_05105 [Pseudomonadota bacterium]